MQESEVRLPLAEVRLAGLQAATYHAQKLVESGVPVNRVVSVIEVALRSGNGHVKIGPEDTHPSWTSLTQEVKRMTEVIRTDQVDKTINQIKAALENLLARQS